MLDDPYMFVIRLTVATNTLIVLMTSKTALNYLKYQLLIPHLQRDKLTVFLTLPIQFYEMYSRRGQTSKVHKIMYSRLRVLSHLTSKTDR